MASASFLLIARRLWLAGELNDDAEPLLAD